MAERNYFKGKRITFVGLGPHGEMVEDAKFLIKAGALVSVYDLKSEARLKNHLVFLRSLGLANYVCGSIPADDLLDSDIIILSHEYPRESTFLEKSREKNIPIEYPETLLLKLAPPLTIIGVLGSVGKSSVASVLAPMLEEVCEEDGTQNFFVADFESGNGIICHLKKAKNGDILLLTIPHFIMSELGRLRMSPHIAIYTTLPQKTSYKESPFEILAYQTYNNFLIASDEIVDLTRTYDFKPRSKMLRTKISIPPIWDFILYEHDKMNVSLALQTAKLFKVSDELAHKVMKKWKPLRGRLELVKKVKGVEFYNDTGSVSPDATIVALKNLSKDRNIVLIMGGVSTGLDYSELIKTIPEYAHTLILIPGSGTMMERKKIEQIENMKILSAPDLEEAVRLAKENANLGDRVLFSPAFDPGGYFESRKERGERFVRAVRLL